ncbi:protein-disulfide reductase DsbD [Thalassolituus sp. LLYu03]|uniref:protein-disulfide reductase DsbD n=1 Tax=Thalassolituus sp. LLYu03 TaxID=3421656 RepID=UPI003D28B3E6
MNLRPVLLLSTLLVWTSLVFAAGLPDLSALDDGDDEFLPVAEAFRADSRPTADGIAVHFTIAPGYYLYQQRLALLGDGAAAATLSALQKPETKQDKNFGEVQVFHQQLDLRITAAADGPLLLSYQGCSEHGLCYPPQTLALKAAAVTPPPPAATAPGADLAGDSLWWVLLSFLGLGIGLSLTPCVFPMIPILSSIIAGQNAAQMSAGKGFGLALSYVAGMACSYALIGMLVAAFGARVNLAAFTQTPIVISLAAILFIVLALPMFGLFELQLPAALRNRLNDMQSRQQGGRLLSTFLMGFFAALVVSPCVSAPLAGALIYLSSTGDILTGGGALFALGMGMGAPLLLIGLSGGRLLPKAGNWMLIIKSAFGVGLLAVALGLLSRIIPAPVTLLLAGMLALGCAVYLGLLEAPHTPRERFARTLALIAALLGVLWISGAALGNGSLLTPLRSGTLEVTAREPVAEARRLESVEQLESLIASSAKPVLVDIAADWCTSCREMDELLHEPHLQPLLAGYELVKFDISASRREQLDLLARWQIFGPPALLRFRHGERDGMALQGLPTEDELTQWLAQ